MIYRVLFVCTGNTCRSAMAKVIYKDKFKNEAKSSRVKSAGIYVRYPRGASIEAIQVMSKWGLDLTKHVSSQITRNDVLCSKVIITMTREHKETVLNNIKESANKIYTLYEYTRGISKDIADPYGKDLDAYVAVAEELKELIDEMIIP